jgi:hypothetical protein
LLWESIPSQDRKPTFDEYGIVSAQYHKNDWSTPTVDFGILKDDLPSDASSASGILRLVYLIFRFAKFRKPADLRALAEFVVAHPVAFAALPQRLRAYAPFDIRRPVLDQARDLAGMSDELMENFILALRSAAAPLKRLQRWVTLGTECDLDQWNKLISDFPDLTWRLWCDNFWTGRMRFRPRVFDDPQALSLLVSRLIEVPSLLTKQPLVVGDLIKKAPKHESELRAAFVKQAQSDRSIDLYGIGDSSFELSLPEESAVLPLILAAFVGDDIFRFPEVSPTDAMNRLRRLCIGFVPHLDSLVALYQDQATAPDIRAAALLLSFIHPDGADRIRSEGTKLVEMYHPTVGPWFFQAAVLNLAHLPDPNEETIDAVVGGLLYVTRGDYEGREVLENYLVDLRERSRGPITKSGLQGEWLSGRK